MTPETLAPLIRVNESGVFSNTHIQNDFGEFWNCEHIFVPEFFN